MENFEKIIEHIKVQSENECRDIAIKANQDTENIRIEYSKKEQDAYLSCIKEGTQKIEERAEKLAAFAEEEANKMTQATQQDMFDEVLDLTARKLSALPTKKYNELLKKLGVDAGCKPEYLVEQYRDDLEQTVINALFN